MRISGLFVYPIKSGAAWAVDAWPLGRFGLEHDREYMVVDEAGRFLTQREAPALALVTARLGQELEVVTPGGSATAPPGRRVPVQVWAHAGEALDCGDEVAGLLTDLLQRPCRLVRVAAEHRRPTTLGGGEVGFADGYPLLLTCVSSLDELNRRMPAPLPMNRFRPNIVIEGTEAYAEDDWVSVELGPVTVDVVKPCDRCSITRVDQATGVRGDGEPLRTLGTFRKAKGGVMFGQNAVHRDLGTLAVGDAVTVVERRS